MKKTFNFHTTCIHSVDNFFFNIRIHQTYLLYSNEYLRQGLAFILYVFSQLYVYQQ